MDRAVWERPPQTASGAHRVRAQATMHDSKRVTSSGDSVDEIGGWADTQSRTKMERESTDNTSRATVPAQGLDAVASRWRCLRGRNRRSSRYGGAGKMLGDGPEPFRDGVSGRPARNTQPFPWHSDVIRHVTLMAKLLWSAPASRENRIPRSSAVCQ